MLGNYAYNMIIYYDYNMLGYYTYTMIMFGSSNMLGYYAYNMIMYDAYNMLGYYAYNMLVYDAYNILRCFTYKLFKFHWKFFISLEWSWRTIVLCSIVTTCNWKVMWYMHLVRIMFSQIIAVTWDDFISAHAI